MIYFLLLVIICILAPPVGFALAGIWVVLWFVGFILGVVGVL